MRLIFIKNISEPDAKMFKFRIIGKKHGVSHFCQNLQIKSNFQFLGPHVDRGNKFYQGSLKVKKIKVTTGKSIGSRRAINLIKTFVETVNDYTD